ncbi:MAG: N-acetyl-gamma-glutamyl-phosphate reductase [Candidatus Omnitrophica bacterium]|nr:N-acetyl-gamma-glutamyl-phosphate reductase [Candidatus Omnitrophota bacterium]
MVKVAVVGATGYTGEELVELLLRNPEVEITSLTGIVEKESDFSLLYPRFGKKISLICKNLDVAEVAKKSDIVFLALPHTVSMKFAPEFLKKGKKVIDLSADYRLPSDVYEKWYGTKHVDADNLKTAVYGLPELNRKNIKSAAFVANPGCFPTSVILGLLPVIKTVSQKDKAIIVDSKTGVTGAGRKGLVSLSFGELDENLRAYKVNEHQHMPEMKHILSGVSGKDIKLNFVPHLMPIRRGIFSTIYISSEGLDSAEKIYEAYKDTYKNEPFVRLRPMGSMPELSDVRGTNFCDIGIKLAGGMLVIVAVIDNLVKGASGQAVQNMNIMYGLDERLGLV